jgi:PAS domain S-box-containing protein
MAEFPSTGRPSEHGRRDEAEPLDWNLVLNDPRTYSFVLLDANVRIVSWSAGAQTLHGFTQQEVLGRPIGEFASASRNEKNDPEHLFKRARTEGQVIEDVWRVRKDGSTFCAKVAVTALYSSAGVLRGYAEVAFDGTDQKCAEEETRRKHELHELKEQRWQHNEKMYRSLMNCMTAHIAVLDRTGTIIMVNDAWERFALENGIHTLERVGVGANYLDVCRNALGHCRYAVQALAGLEATLRGEIAEFTLEYPCHSLERNRWFHMSATLSNVDGGVLVSHTDITERVLAERRLQESEAHYRAIIENELDIVTILDENAVVKFESPALQRVLGYRPEELIGRNVFDFIHPDDAENVRRELSAVLASSEPSRPVEFQFRHKESGWRVVESIARNLLANPWVNGVIVNSRDITDRREAEAAIRIHEAELKLSHERLQALSGRLLETEDRERRRLSRELHDDLNQRLAVLAVDMGALRNSLRDSAPDDVEREFLAIQARIVKLSEDVRTLAYQLHPSILDDLGLAVALRSYCEEFSRREGIQVEFAHRNLGRHVAPDVASCIYRVAQEGLRNVAKHSGAKQAWVSVIGTSRHVNLTVRDAGAGFAAESITAHHSLGLTSMAERTRLINGRFQVASAPGKGTTVQIRVPRKVDSP